MDMSALFSSSEKGISPLIAAVLLIAFTMTIAAILATWAQTFGEERLGEAGERGEEVVECGRLNLEIESASYNNDIVEDVVIWNRGPNDVGDISFVVYDDGPNMFDDVSYTDNGDEVRISSGNFARLEAEGGSVNEEDVERLEVHAQPERCPDIQPIDTCEWFIVEENQFEC